MESIEYNKRRAEQKLWFVIPASIICFPGSLHPAKHNQ